MPRQPGPQPAKSQTTSRGQTVITGGQNGTIRIVRPARPSGGQAGANPPSAKPINQTPTSAPAPPPKK